MLYQTLNHRIDLRKTALSGNFWRDIQRILAGGWFGLLLAIFRESDHFYFERIGQNLTMCLKRIGESSRRKDHATYRPAQRFVEELRAKDLFETSLSFFSR